MKTLLLRTGSQKPLDEWFMKEYGSWEDNNKDQNHACAIIQRLKPNTTNLITKKEAEILLKSASYHATAWHDCEIEGGRHTKKALSAYCKKLRAFGT